MKIVAWLWRNPIARPLLFVAIAFEIYTHGLLPLYYATAELPGLYAQDRIQREKAAVAPQKYKGEMEKFKGEALLKRAEAEEAVRQAKADAELMEEKAAKMEPLAAIAERTASSKIAAANHTYVTRKITIEREYIGRPLPDIRTLRARQPQ